MHYCGIIVKKKEIEVEHYFREKDVFAEKDQRIAELEIENETLSNALLEKPDNLELLQLREDLKILSKQNAHKEHMENLRLKTELAIRDLALEQMMTDYLEDMRLLKYEEPKESIVLYLNKAEKQIEEKKKDE